MPITANGWGWVDRRDNPLGIQGSWSTKAGTDSSISLAIDHSRLCFSGNTGQVLGTPSDYVTYWGASGTLDLCRTAPPGTSSGTVHTLGTCPWSPGLDQTVVGFRFVLEGTLPRELRLVFRERGRDTSTYVTLAQTGTVVALFEDALIANDPQFVPLDPTELESIEFFASPSRRASVAFDFCLRNLEVLTGSGWRSLEVPDWALEPGPGLELEFGGVNLAGAEFGQQNLPGVYAVDYIYPGPADVDAFAAAGMNSIRLPFRWERLERTLGAAFDPEELARLRGIVDYATGRNLHVILDPHNFARYTVQVIGVDLEARAFADFWRRLAEVFAANPRVIFGLMNEPHDLPTEAWLDAANAAILAIRQAGAENLVLVPGNGWTGAHNWASSYYGTPNSIAMAGVVDPSHRFAFELHQYLDSDSSGTGRECVSETIGPERMAVATRWLRERGFRAFLGEFGAPANFTCLKAIDNLLAYLGDNADVWMGWAVWAGGPWWGESPLTVQPRVNGKDRPQMAVLRRYLNAP